MKAILVRVAVDHSYGHWNAPVELESGHFVYVPIPEKEGTSFLPGLACHYDRIMPALNEFCKRFAPKHRDQLGFPQALQKREMHLDPDFKYLTYGDRGDRRGAGMSRLTEGDLLVFYAGLRPVRPVKEKLVYALVGLYVVQDVVQARSVPQSLRSQNAHTRKEKIGRPDIVVTAKPVSPFPLLLDSSDDSINRCSDFASKQPQEGMDFIPGVVWRELPSQKTILWQHGIERCAIWRSYEVRFRPESVVSPR
jgi:hypothetical protein